MSGINTLSDLDLILSPLSTEARAKIEAALNANPTPGEVVHRGEEFAPVAAEPVAASAPVDPAEMGLNLVGVPACLADGVELQ